MSENETDHDHLTDEVEQDAGRKKLRALLHKMRNDRQAAGRYHGARDKRVVDDTNIETICDLLEAGCTMREVCSLPDMPSEPAFRRATRDGSKYQTRIETARARGADAILDDARDLIEAMKLAWIDETDPDTSRVLTSGSLAIHKIAMEQARLLAPKKFGDLIKMADADGNALSVTVMTFGDKAGSDGTESS